MASLSDPLANSLRELRTDSAEGRALAHQQLVAAGGDPDAIDRLVQALDDTSWGFRTRLARVLTEVGSAAVPALETAIAYGVWYVRAAAAEALAAILEEGAIKALQPLLNDRAVGVRTAAAEGVARHCTAAHLPELVESLQGLDRDRLEPLLRALRRNREELYLELLALCPELGPRGGGP